MLEIGYPANTWSPPTVSQEETDNIIKGIARCEGSYSYLCVITTEPYIDVLRVVFCDGNSDETFSVDRYTFHEGYIWDYETEDVFLKTCVQDPGCIYSGSDMDRIYGIYSGAHQEWHLRRYRLNRGRLLDHIYNCLKSNTAKEILYKAGLDELAVNLDSIDELCLLASRPSDIYEGISMRTLRALNCPDGPILLSTHDYREYIKELQKYYPDIFRRKLNSAQCRYIRRLIDGHLTAGECGRLYRSRESALSMIWSKTGYEIFIASEVANDEKRMLQKKLSEQDPVYADHIRQSHQGPELDKFCRFLGFHLLFKKRRDECDKKIRRNNRSKPRDWEERDHGYIIRFPRTINDFLREAVYMRNCLVGYTEAFLENDTTILFMRKTDDVNQPFITIEIFDKELKQAYHRFNENCTPEEAEWIREYCARHGINCGKFSFGAGEDLLM